MTAISASNVWAVGQYSNDPNNATSQTLAEHWNGTTWTQVPSPNPSSGDNFLGGVAATSPASILAVGAYATGSPGRGRRILAFHCC